MKKLIKRGLILILAIAMIAPTLLIPSAANESGTLTTYDATIMSAKGGASAIATMTFDDGKTRTAARLNELCAEYGAKASLMLIPAFNLATEENIEFWKMTLSPGYLAAESHSYTHDYLTSNPENTNPEHLNEEKYNYETKGALDAIRGAFPDQDVLAMTIPYANYIADARKHVIKNYYAALAGACALTTSSLNGKVMSLDPTFGDPSTGSTPAGSWHNVIYTRLQPIYSDSVYPQLTMENIIGYLDRCVESGGWFITSCHGIYEGENQDLTEEQLVMLLEAMAAHVENNDLWIATFSEATKYVRERQNSKATVKTYGDGIYYVDLTMADTTADGLSLTTTVAMPDGTTRKIFDMPLTVKVEVPSSWTAVSYSQAGGEEMTAETFTELGKTYAYVDLVPNGGTAEVKSSDGTVGDVVVPDLPAGSYTKPEGTYTPANTAVTYAAWNSEADFLAGNAPEAEYTDTSLLDANIAGWGYIQLYANLPSADKINPTTDIVINLAGFEITLPMGTKIGNNSDRKIHFTMKNGFVNNQGQMHIRKDCTVIFDNLDITSTSKWVGYGVAADLWRFKDSKLTLNASDIHFHLVGTSSGKECELEILNTDIVIVGSVSDKGLFSFMEQVEITTNWTVFIDSESSATGRIDKWATCMESENLDSAGNKQYFSETQMILFEEGFYCTETAKPSFKYSKLLTEDYSTYTVAEANIPANDATLRMAVAKSGSKYPLLGDVTYNKEGSYYVIGVENGKLDAPVGTYVTPEGVWTPASDDVTYAMWASEALYLAGTEPYRQYTDTALLMSNFSTGGYVHLYKDLDSTENISVTGSNALTLDLAGHTLTIASTYTFSTSGSGVLNVKNGKVITSRQLSFRGDSEILFENIHFVNSNATFGYGSAFVNWTLKDCLIELNSATSYIYIGGNAPSAGKKTEMYFLNTDIVVNGGTHATNGLFNFVRTGKNYSPKVYFDKDSSVSGNVGVFATAIEAVNIIFNDPIEFYLEEGFTVSSGINTGIFKYTGTLREGEEGNYTLGTATERDVNDGKLNVIVHLTGETSATEYDYEFVLKGGDYVLDIIDPNEEPEIWEPAADTVYATWASKEDYLAGKAPVGEFNSALTVNGVTYAGNNNYVRIFKNATVSEQLVIGTGATIVIDIAGNTLDNAAGIEIWNGTSLTIENGVYNHTGGQVYYAPVSYMTYRNLVITETSGHTLSYGYGATELIYENCTVTITNSNNYFRFGSQSGTNTCTLNVIGTEFIVNAELSSHFISIFESSWGYDARWTVNVDAESSITGSGSMPGLVKLTEAFRYVEGGSIHEQFVNTQTFTFADGFTMSENLVNAPSYYTFVELDFDASVAAKAEVFKDPVSLLGNDARCVITINEDTLIVKTAWSPAADTTYAVWASKDDYLAGNAPIAEYSGDILAANVAADGVGYVRLFAETVKTADRLDILNGATVVIDLGGNTLNLNSGIEVYNGTTVTIENGYYNHNGGQAYFRTNSWITYRDLIINVTTSSNLTYGYGFNEMIYERCTVTLTKASHFFRLSSNTVSRCALKIIDTDFIINAALSEHFFRINESSYSGEEAHWDILVDKDSSITGTGSMPGLVKLVEVFANNTTAPFTATQNIVIEDGFTIAKNLITDFSVYTFVAVESEASAAAGEAVYKDAVTKLASDEFCKIYLGETLVNDGTMYANPNSDGTAYSVSYAMDKVNVGWYRLDASTGAWIGTLAVKNENGVATFSNADFKKLSGGETIIFAQDIELADEIQSNRADLTDITFDLGGNKITIPATIPDGFDLSLYTNAYHRLALTWKNGTIDCFIRQPFYGYGGATSVFTFDNVTLNYEDTGIILDCYFGTWIVKNSTINAPNGTAIAFQKADGYQNVQIENSTINAKTPIRMYIHGSTAISSDNFYIKNSTVNATNCVIWAVEGAAHTAASYFELGISGCKINSPAIMNVSSAVVGKVSVTMSDTYFVTSPVLKIDSSTAENTAIYKVAAKTGEKIMGIDGVEGYSYYVGKITVNSGDFQANLTLHSDFNLNFHANKDTILAVYYNGTALELVDYNGMAVYSIKDIRPDTAAEALEFVVWVKQGEVIYKVPLTYSVLKYAEAVVGDGTVVNTGTKLVSAVMNYVKAAYEYVGKTAPEFEGVTYTAPTVTAPDAFSHSAIKGVQLSLDTEIGVRFNLNSAYTGALTVDGATYQIVGGKLDGTNVDYVVANVRAYEFADKGIEVSDTSDSAVYTLAHYITYAKGENNANLEALVTALYEYSYYANEYKNN